MKMVRVIAFSMWVVLGATAGVWGQSAGSNWDRVKQIQAETTIRVKSSGLGGRRRVTRCAVVSVSDTELICASGRARLFAPVSRELRFPRSDVREVRLTRRLLSGAVGGAIGVGIGVGAGYALAGPADRADDPGVLQFVFGLLGGSLGAALGAGSDFLGGPVIYRAP